MKCIVAASLAVMACSSSNNHTADAPGNGSGSSSGGACQLTLSGALTGTYSCTANTGYDGSNGKGGFGVTVSGAPEQITIGVGWMGMPQAKSYKQSDADATGGVGIVMGTNVWDANSASGGNAAVGTYDLSFTTLGNATTNGTQTIYSAHGSFTAMAPSRTGGGASVTVSMTF